MASHHHPCHHPPPVTAPNCCRCNCTPPPLADPFLQSIASHFLLHHHPPPSHPQPQPQPQPQPNPNPPFTHQTEYHPPQIHKHKKHSRNYRRQESDEEEEQTLPIISSLLRRIAVLESSLRRHSPAHFSLRDAAARIIQTHFRAFLIRRSRTLRQLKDLAFIKSALSILKSSISDTIHFDYHALSHETMGLLIRLESIQGGDPMIRDGKRSISRELIRFLEFIDDVSLERHVLYSRRSMKNVGFDKNGFKSRVSLVDHRKKTADRKGSGGNEQKVLEKLRNRVQKIEELSRVYEEEEEEEKVGVRNKGISINGNCSVSQHRVGGLTKRQDGDKVQVQPKVKKNVRFVENGDVYRIIRSSNGPGSSGDSDSIDESDLADGERELMNNLGKEAEEIRVSPKETQDKDHEEEGTTEETESTELSGDDKDEDDNGFVFTAPLPVKMEARADLMNKKQPLRK